MQKCKPCTTCTTCTLHFGISATSATNAKCKAGGLLDEFEVKQALQQVALSIGLKSNELNATLKSGFDAGIKTPRTPDTISQNKVIVSHAPAGDSAGERKIQGRNSAPNGFNPYSGEIFDKRGYPASWGKIQAPEPGTIEYMEAEYYRAMDADPILKVIDTLFEPKLIIET